MPPMMAADVKVIGEVPLMVSDVPPLMVLLKVTTPAAVKPPRVLVVTGWPH